MSMFQAMIEGAMAAVGLTPEQVNNMVHDAVSKINDMDARMKRMEARQKQVAEKLGIPALQEVLPPSTQEQGNNGERSEAG